MMGDFFRGWRRKLGGITLAMACVLASAWVRSFSEYHQRWSRSFDEATSYSVTLRNDDIRIESLTSSKTGFYRERSIAIPYVLAVPLTLSSAYLLLWQPNLRKVHQISSNNST